MSLASRISAIASTITGAAKGLGGLGASLGISIGGGKGLSKITSTVGQAVATEGQATAATQNVVREIINVQKQSASIASEVSNVEASIEEVSTEIHNFLVGFTLYSADSATDGNLTIQGEKLLYMKSETGDFEEGFYLTGIKETIDCSNGYWPDGIVNGNGTACGYSIGTLFSYEKYMAIPEEIRKEIEEIMNREYSDDAGAREEVDEGNNGGDNGDEEEEVMNGGA